MKKLEELGISPAPWNVDGKDVRDASGYGVVYYYYSSLLRKADAKLIAAAPELYEALHEAVEEYLSSWQKQGDALCEGGEYGND